MIGLGLDTDKFIHAIRMHHTYSGSGAHFRALPSSVWAFKSQRIVYCQWPSQKSKQTTTKEQRTKANIDNICSSRMCVCIRSWCDDFMYPHSLFSAIKSYIWTCVYKNKCVYIRSDSSWACILYASTINRITQAHRDDLNVYCINNEIEKTICCLLFKNSEWNSSYSFHVESYMNANTIDIARCLLFCCWLLLLLFLMTFSVSTKNIQQIHMIREYLFIVILKSTSRHVKIVIYSLEFTLYSLYLSWIHLIYSAEKPVSVSNIQIFQWILWFFIVLTWFQLFGLKRMKLLTAYSWIYQINYSNLHDSNTKLVYRSILQYFIVFHTINSYGNGGYKYVHQMIKNGLKTILKH